ncbi:SDR family oxidoreductase [bacterium]|nr:SDR family oxidoreductase [bacterium]
MARFLSEKGYIVYGTSRKIVDKNQFPFTTLVMDVTDSESIADGIKLILDKEKKIDVVINNAGIGIAGALEDMSIEEVTRQFDTNFFGIVRVIQTVLPHMRERKEGKIINISSIAGMIGLPFQSFYSASKFAIEGLTESLRLELEPFNIKVTNISPGDFHTSFTKNRVLAKKSADSVYSEQFKKTLAVYEHDELNGANPFVLARLVESVIREKSPRVRYLTGMVSQKIVTRLKPLFGSRTFELLMKIHCKIN